MTESSPKRLHRLENNQNDWDNVPADKLNRWQRIAKKTKGILTIGNSITLTGTVLVINGLFNFANGNHTQGTAEVVAGRALDLADGAAANATETKGRIGRDFDAGVDGLQLLTALGMLASNEAVPIQAALITAAPKVVDVLSTGVSKVRGIDMNPTEEGKLSVAAIWAGIGAFMLKSSLDNHLPGFADVALETLGWGGTVGGSLYHLPATRDYLETAFASTQESA